MLAEVTRLADGLTADEIQRHPAKALLFQARHGRLDLARQCPTPRRTIALARALGLTTPAPPE